MNRNALLLDLDGTVANSLGVMATVYEEFLAAHSRSASHEEFSSLNGPPLKEVVLTLKETHQLGESFDTLYADYQQRIDSAYQNVLPHPGVDLLLKTAKNNNWKIALVTSNSLERSEKWLKNTGLKKFFETIVAGEHITNGKPHPEPYLLALERLDCVAEISIAIEDSLTGAHSASAAGVRTFMLSATKTEIPEGILTISKFDDVIPYMSEIYRERRSDL